MTVKKRKKFCSDECSEIHTIRHEETRSDSTSKESVLRQPFRDIIINFFCLPSNIQVKNPESLQNFEKNFRRNFVKKS